MSSWFIFLPSRATIRFSQIIEWNWNRPRCRRSNLIFSLLIEISQMDLIENCAYFLCYFSFTKFSYWYSFLYQFSCECEMLLWVSPSSLSLCRCVLPFLSTFTSMLHKWQRHCFIVSHKHIFLVLDAIRVEGISIRGVRKTHVLFSKIMMIVTTASILCVCVFPCFT